MGFVKGDLVHIESTNHIGVYVKEKTVLWATDKVLDNLWPDNMVVFRGPIYEKAGRKFVPSPEEARLPKKGEYYYNETMECVGGPLGGDWPANQAGSDIHGGTRRILLPVPALPEEPEHEFKIGDWVKAVDGFTGQVTRISNYVYWGEGCASTPDNLTLLPGRPLTTDDLLQVLSGKRIMVECHACGCEGDTGRIACKPPGYAGSVEFRHGRNLKGSSYPIAGMSDGSIVFATGVEGNIFVVPE